MVSMTRQTYTIQKRIQETRNTFLWHAAPKEGEIFDFLPGQFTMICAPHENPPQKKAYSIASSPTNKAYLEFGIKTHGDFTQQLSLIKENDDIIIEGPYGHFMYDKNSHKKAAFFAGGIGITPFMSMIRFAATDAKENHIHLFYCNQTEHDIAYKAELDDLAAANKNFTVTYSVDTAVTPAWKGDVGLITENLILTQYPNFEETIFFMCGPVPFMEAVKHILINHHVPRESIKREVF